MSSTGFSRTRTRWGFTAVVAAAGLAAALPASTGSTTSDPHWQRVIISGTAGSLHKVEQAVRTTGGHVTKVLHIVNGVSARVPATSVPALRSRKRRCCITEPAGYPAKVISHCKLRCRKNLIQLCIRWIIRIAVDIEKIRTSRQVENAYQQKCSCVFHDLHKSFSLEC